MMAASVEDFPEPVGPVTRTMPLRRCTISSSCGGRFNCSKAGNGIGNHAHDDGVGAALAKDIDAEAGEAGEAVGKIGGAILLEFADGMLVLADDVVGNEARVVRAQRFQALEFQLHEFAADFDLRGASGRKDQVADVAVGLEHRGDELGGVNGALERGLRRRCLRRWCLRSCCHGSFVSPCGSSRVRWVA